MSAAFFAPTTKITGGALFVSFNSKEGSVYFKFLKQIANNPDKKKNFDSTALHFKLTQDEAADTIQCVRNKDKTSFYHSFGEEKTTGKFGYYEIAQDGKDPRRGFSLSIKRNETEIRIGFTLGGAERLAQFLEFALDHIFSADYAADKKAFQERQEKKSKSDSSDSAGDGEVNKEEDPEW